VTVNDVLTPAVNLSASEIWGPNASSVSTCSSVARIAATDSALPARVPADAAGVDQVGAIVVHDSLGQRGDNPNAPPNAAAEDLPLVRDRGRAAKPWWQPPGPCTERCAFRRDQHVPVDLVSSLTAAR